MILPKVRDPRLVTIRRGGSVTDADHHLLSLWAASCAEHVLHLFEAEQPEDDRPRHAIDPARAWVRGEVPMMVSRAAGGHAMGAARPLRGAARSAAYAAGQAACVAHVPEHELGAAAYAIKAVGDAAPGCGEGRRDATRVSVAAGPAPGLGPRARARGPAPAQRHLLVSLRRPKGVAASISSLGDLCVARRGVGRDGRHGRCGPRGRDHIEDCHEPGVWTARHGSVRGR
jgi:hypothetical protein